VAAFWPPRTETNSLKGNNDSIVLRLTYGSVSFLLTGDIEGPAETWLSSLNTDLSADLLKVPHHGSKTSSTAWFVDKVKPTYAVISVGVRSRFGHPDPQIVSRYVQRGVQVLETGRDGMVTAETDGTQP
jgi:competence protein ComEC